MPFSSVLGRVRHFEENSAFGEGFYMLCFNLTLLHLSSPKAVRILSSKILASKSEVAFNEIKADIIQGMTDSFIDIYGNEETRRIFLDIVGCVGDAPPINSALNVFGHKATACCHVCRFRRDSCALVGSNYTAHFHHCFITGLLRAHGCTRLLSSN